MSRTPEQDVIFKEERRIGKKAAKMAENYLLQVLKQKLIIKNEGFPEGPILEDTTVKHKMGEFRLLGLNLSSSKTGFILNYGFVGIREATSVFLQASRYKKARTQRKRHSFNLPGKHFFEDDIYGKSGAIDLLLSELSKTRTAGAQIKLDGLVLKLNAQENVK